jgi:hypothetical protein
MVPPFATTGAATHVTDEVIPSVDDGRQQAIVPVLTAGVR